MVIFELAQGIFFARNFFASSYSPRLLGVNVNIIIPGNQVDDVKSHLPLLPILHRSAYDLFPTSIVSLHKSLPIVQYFLLVHRQWNPTTSLLRKSFGAHAIHEDHWAPRWMVLRAPSDTYWPNSLATLIEIDDNWMTASLLERPLVLLWRRGRMARFFCNEMS